jgi:hypothetical protein
LGYITSLEYFVRKVHLSEQEEILGDYLSLNDESCRSLEIYPDSIDGRLLGAALERAFTLGRRHQNWLVTGRGIPDGDELMLDADLVVSLHRKTHGQSGAVMPLRDERGRFKLQCKICSGEVKDEDLGRFSPIRIRHLLRCNHA